MGSMNAHRLLALLLLLPWILGVSPVGAQGDPKDKKGGPPLPDGLKALKHADANVRYKAVHTLAEVGSLAKFAVPDLREMLADSNPLVRVKVAEALWKIEKTPTTVLLPVLLQALKDKDPSARAAAPTVIVLFGSKAKSALPALTLALHDKVFGVKVAAVVALGDLGPLARDSAPALLDLANDKEFFLLEPFVGAALTNLGESIVPTLVKALNDPSFDRRRVAAYSLGSMGPSARTAQPPCSFAAACASRSRWSSTRARTPGSSGGLTVAASQFGSSHTATDGRLAAACTACAATSRSAADSRPTRLRRCRSRSPRHTRRGPDSSSRSWQARTCPSRQVSAHASTRASTRVHASAA